MVAASVHGAFTRASQPDWRDQVQQRLVAEFVDRAATAEIEAEINRAHAEIDAVPTAALPELVERLVRVRLAHRC
jgi:hypothetical protein